MYRTIQISSCISVQGEIVDVLSDGTMLVRDGSTLYRGRPIEPREADPTPRPFTPELAAVAVSARA